jgi:di/tricarboxylate transporter
VAYRILGLFKPGYLTMTISWVIIGLLLSVFTPSITVRIAIMVPLAVASAEICRQQYGMKGSSYILLLAWSMAILPGCGWVTGSLWGPMAIGYFNSTPGLEGSINFGSWIQGMLLPAELLTFIFIALLFVFMRPKEKLTVNGDVFKAEYKALGPMSFREKATLTILGVTFLMLVTSQFSGIPDVAICLGAFALLAAAGVIKAADIGPAISWDLVVFLGSAMGLSLILQVSGVAAFLSESFMPAVSVLAAHPWILLFVVLIGLFVWRFLDVAQLYPTIPFLMPFLPLLFIDFGINPLVLYMIFIMAGNFFFLTYQQPFAILGQSLAKESSWSSGQLRQAGTFYAIACIATLAVTIPYWMAIGYIK